LVNENGVKVKVGGCDQGGVWESQFLIWKGLQKELVILNVSGG
jgi:hypothetical protein